MGTGHEGTVDGTEVNCTFTQVQGICSLQNTIFVSDIAAGYDSQINFRAVAQCPSFAPSEVSTTVLGLVLKRLTWFNLRCCEQCFT